MSSPTRRTAATVILSFVLGLCGLALTGGGGWLIALGGSWYYLITGVAFLLTAWLLFAGHLAAMWLYGMVILGSLAWALWEAGLDWWPLATRGGIIFAIGLLLLTPWITRPLRRDDIPVGRRPGLPVASRWPPPSWSPPPHGSSTPTASTAP